jgi:hypothetical protein
VSCIFKKCLECRCIEPILPEEQFYWHKRKGLCINCSGSLLAWLESMNLPKLNSEELAEEYFYDEFGRYPTEEEKSSPEFAAIIRESIWQEEEN